MEYKLRVTEIDDEESLTEWIQKHTSYILVKEHNPKIHYHAYFITDQKEDTLRKQLQKLLQGKGNKVYSLSNKHENWPGYIGYCLKHEDTEVLSVSLPNDLDFYKDEYHQKCEQAELQKDLRKKQNKDKPVWEHINDHLKEKMYWENFEIENNKMIQMDMHRFSTNEISAPEYFNKYVEQIVAETMKFLEETGRELDNTRIQRYVENYLNRNHNYFRFRTINRLARTITK